MTERPSLFAELKRRNVLRAAAVYIAAVWALAQGIAQLGPFFHAPGWTVRWFVIACVIGFPFWVAFAWFYAWTPQGFKRESEVEQDASLKHSTGRKLDFAIIGVLAIAIVLLASGYFVRRGATDTGIPAKSVAVLPFTNESGDKGEQYFSDGLSEDLITALSQFQDLKVISRHSAFQFRDTKDSSAVIGQKLGVAHLLEGSVQKLGNEVRVSATLVNASDGSVAWSAQFDEPYTDLFALQDALTEAVSRVLQAKLRVSHAAAQNERPPSGNLEAWQAYQQGKFYFGRVTQADVRKALDYFATAIRLDPRYAAAYAEASFARTLLAVQYLTGTAKQQAYAQARAESAKAVALAPDLALAHAARGNMLQYAHFDWKGAQTEYQRAEKLAPNDATVLYQLGMLDATLGRVQAAVELVRKGLDADPLNANRYIWLGTYLVGLGRLDAAQQAIDKAIELQPAADAFHTVLAIVAIVRGDAKAALAIAQQETKPPWHQIALALATQVGPDRKAADAALQTIIVKYADGAPYQIAEAYALRRDPDDMFQWLDRAWAARDPGVTNLLFDPFILRYRADPRFTAFCKKVGLPTTTDAVAMK